MKLSTNHALAGKPLLHSKYKVQYIDFKGLLS